MFVSNAINPATSGTIRLGNNQSISWTFADNSASASLSLNALHMFSFSHDVTMNGRHIEDVNNTRLKYLHVAANGVVILAHTEALSRIK